MVAADGRMSGGGERRTRLDGESVCGGDEKGDDEGGDGEDHGKNVDRFAWFLGVDGVSRIRRV